MLLMYSYSFQQQLPVCRVRSCVHIVPRSIHSNTLNLQYNLTHGSCISITSLKQSKLIDFIADEGIVCLIYDIDQ